jgi:large subunit ribosomal protein L13
MVNAKTFSQRTEDTSREWFLIDAADIPLGRTATKIANLLIGKSKVTYTPHVDNGDYVVVINAEQLVVTGDKEVSKKYYRHSGYPGGISDATLKEVRSKKPERIIESAVKGMIPKNKLAAGRMARLRVFAGSDHTHTAQTPKIIWQQNLLENTSTDLGAVKVQPHVHVFTRVKVQSLSTTSLLLNTSQTTRRFSLK